MGENSKEGNVLSTEMRYKPTNMLRQSGTRDKNLVPNLPLPLTFASELMAQSVFLFKMSHKGTVNTVSQLALRNTLADTKWEMQQQDLKQAPQRTTLNTVYCMKKYFND